jgi:DNA-binding transcriptional regulator YdaS (Cro superfamily)
MSQSAIHKAVEAAGGQSALARALGKRQSTVWDWVKRGNVPAEHVAGIEAATGIPRHVLRPDLWPPSSPKEAAE